MNQRKTPVDIQGRMRDYSQSPVRRLVARKYISDNQPIAELIKDSIPKGITPASLPSTDASKSKVKSNKDLFALRKFRNSPVTEVRIPGLPIPPKAVVLPHKHVTSRPARPRQSKSKVLLRQALFPPHIAVDNSTHHKNVTHKKKKLRTNIIFAVVAAIFLSCVYASWHTWYTNRGVVAHVQGVTTGGHSRNAPSVGTDSAMPEETDVTESRMKAFKVGPSMPRYISIEKLGIKGRVKRMGLTNGGAIETPKNINDAGWYEGSAKPGDPSSAALIVGYVDGPSKPAIFSKINELRDGDVIDIERGDGLHVRYQVVARDVLSGESTDIAKALVAFDPYKPGLNIITYLGANDTEASTKNQRLIVYAVQI